MQYIFYELLEFFGINSSILTFTDLITWIVSVSFAIGLFMFVFNIIRAFITYMPKWTKL